jgi:alkylation response protein AidB-like acyl-CoA dehydrogenase
LPKELRIGEEGQGARLVSIYLAGSRGPVGAIGTGIARRALECLVDWAKQKKTYRGRLIDQQSMQLTIAKMAQEIEMARQAYVNAALAYDLFVENLLTHPVTRLALLLLPKGLAKTDIAKALLSSDRARKFTGGILAKAIPEDRLALASVLSTLAKVKGSNVGVWVAGEAVRLMGHDASDPRWPVEKCFRDAKLTQIYEGTNQANTITFFKDMVRTWQER